MPRNHSTEELKADALAVMLRLSCFGQPKSKLTVQRLRNTLQDVNLNLNQFQESRLERLVNLLTDDDLFNMMQAVQRNVAALELRFKGKECPCCGGRLRQYKQPQQVKVLLQDRSLKAARLVRMHCSACGLVACPGLVYFKHSSNILPPAARRQQQQQHHAGGAEGPADAEDMWGENSGARAAALLQGDPGGDDDDDDDDGGEASSRRKWRHVFILGGKYASPLLTYGRQKLWVQERLLEEVEVQRLELLASTQRLANILLRTISTDEDQVVSAAARPGDVLGLDDKGVWLRNLLDMLEVMKAVRGAAQAHNQQQGQQQDQQPGEVQQPQPQPQQQQQQQHQADNQQQPQPLQAVVNAANLARNVLFVLQMPLHPPHRFDPAAAADDSDDAADAGGDADADAYEDVVVVPESEAAEPDEDESGENDAAGSEEQAHPDDPGAAEKAEGEGEEEGEAAAGHSQGASATLGADPEPARALSPSQLEWQLLAACTDQNRPCGPLHGLLEDLIARPFKTKGGNLRQGDHPCALVPGADAAVSVLLLDVTTNVQVRACGVPGCRDPPAHGNATWCQAHAAVSQGCMVVVKEADNGNSSWRPCREPKLRFTTTCEAHKALDAECGHHYAFEVHGAEGKPEVRWDKAAARAGGLGSPLQGPGTPSLMGSRGSRGSLGSSHAGRTGGVPFGAGFNTSPREQQRQLQQPPPQQQRCAAGGADQEAGPLAHYVRPREKRDILALTCAKCGMVLGSGLLWHGAHETSDDGLNDVLGVLGDILRQQGLMPPQQHLQQQQQQPCACVVIYNDALHMQRHLRQDASQQTREAFQHLEWSIDPFRYLPMFVGAHSAAVDAAKRAEAAKRVEAASTPVGGSGAAAGSARAASQSPVADMHGSSGRTATEVAVLIAAAAPAGAGAAAAAAASPDVAAAAAPRGNSRAATAASDCVQSSPQSPPNPAVEASQIAKDAKKALLQVNPFRDELEGKLWCEVQLPHNCTLRTALDQLLTMLPAKQDLADGDAAAAADSAAASLLRAAGARLSEGGVVSLKEMQWVLQRVTKRSCTQAELLRGIRGLTHTRLFFRFNFERHQLGAKRVQPGTEGCRRVTLLQVLVDSEAVEQLWRRLQPGNTIGLKTQTRGLVQLWSWLKLFNQQTEADVAFLQEHVDPQGGKGLCAYADEGEAEEEEQRRLCAAGQPVSRELLRSSQRPRLHLVQGSLVPSQRFAIGSIIT